MHAKPNNSSYRNRGGPRDAIEAKRGVVESQTDGAFAAPTFLSLHRLHLISNRLRVLDPNKSVDMEKEKPKEV